MANTVTQFITKCVIDPKDRTITPENGGIVGVAHDYAVDAAQFVFPLTFSEISLSGNTTKRFVRYRKSGSDKWYVDQLTSAVVQDDTAGTYSFTWTLSNDAALIADEGFVYCALCIQEFENTASTKVVREWNSQLCRLVVAPSADHTSNYISPTLLTDNAVIAAINAEVDSVSKQEFARNSEAFGLSTGLSALEQSIASHFKMERTGKIYQTRIYKFASNTSTKGEKMLANKGLVCTPSTDTVENQDDYADIPLFQWWHADYKRDDADGFARPTALKSFPAYKESGAVDVGSLHMSFYWKWDVHDTYTDVAITDTPHAGFSPWPEQKKKDGTDMPYWIQSAYPSITASDGLLRSQPGASPAYNQSYNSQVDDYQKKGKGYWGSSILRNMYMYLMCIIKYGTKSSGDYFTGCTDYQTQASVAVAETGVKRVLVSDIGDFYAGGCVSVGKANGTDKDRQNASMHSVCNRVLVKSIENVTIGSTTYKALNLDISKPITTTKDMIVSTMPCWTGTTDAVIGHHDGSPTSCTDFKHAFRIGGQEYMLGQSIIPSNIMLEFNSDYSKNVLVFPRGTAHLKDSKTGTTKVGVIPNIGDAADFFVGDVSVDVGTGAYWPSAAGSGDSVGTGDYYSAGGKITGLKKWYSLGNLGRRSWTGACYLNCGVSLGVAFWSCGSCD